MLTEQGFKKVADSLKPLREDPHVHHVLTVTCQVTIRESINEM